MGLVTPASSRCFDPTSLSALDEPVQRYLNHALAPAAVIAGGRRLSMAGRIRVGDQDTARSEGGRAVAESIMDPASLLPDNGVSWQAERDDLIVARFDVPPERAELRLRIGTAGALRSVEIMRWGNSGQDGFGYIPFGGDIHAECRFGDLMLPSELTIGWWYGTARYRPFFEATIHDARECRA